MYFLDTSAIAKRYVMEIGTPWIKNYETNLSRSR